MINLHFEMSESTAENVCLTYLVLFPVLCQISFMLSVDFSTSRVSKSLDINGFPGFTCRSYHMLKPHYMLGFFRLNEKS